MPLPTTGLLVHQKSSSLVFKDQAGTIPATAEGDAILNWGDLSGSGNAASAGANGFTLHFDTHGTPYVKSLSGHSLNYPGAVSFGNTAPCTIVAIYKLIDTTNADLRVINGFNGSFFGPYSAHFTAYAGFSNSASQFVAGQPLIHGISYDGVGNRDHYVNGGKVDTQSGATSLGQCYLYGANAYYRELLFYSRQLSAAEWDEITRYAVSIETFAPHLTFDGNSLVRGAMLSNPATQSWPAQLVALLGANVSMFENFGTDGNTTAQRTAAAFATSPLGINFAYTPAADPNTLFFLEGGNSIVVGGETATQAVADYQAYMTSQRLACPRRRIIVMDVADRGDLNPATRAAFNAQVGALFPISTANPYLFLAGDNATATDGDGLLKLGSLLPQMQDHTNTIYYQSDGVHWTLAMTTLVAQTLFPIVQALNSISARDQLSRLFLPPSPIAASNVRPPIVIDAFGDQGTYIVNPSAPGITVQQTTAGGIVSISGPATAGTNAIANYKLYQSTTPGGEGGTAAQTLSAGGLTFPAAFAPIVLSAGQTLYWTVKAVDSAANVGPSSNEVTVNTNTGACTLTFTDGGIPVVGASVYVTTDSGGAVVIAGINTTNTLGKVAFTLTSGTTYYCWMTCPGQQPIAGKPFVASLD